jgi:polyphosphate kinase
MANSPCTGRLGECHPAPQLAVLKRSVPRPKLNNRDRLFWIGLYMIWQDWKSALMIVQPETVTSWHRKRCRRYWWKLSQSKQPSRRAWTPIFPPALANGSSDIFAIIRTGDQLLEHPYDSLDATVEHVVIFLNN